MNNETSQNKRALNKRALNKRALNKAKDVFEIAQQVMNNKRDVMESLFWTQFKALLANDKNNEARTLVKNLPECPARTKAYHQLLLQLADEA